jgi:NAD(P)-dependent dehydrogenase (short-subunit alcohol dehydrogenase family)
MLALTRQLAVEYGPDVRVNAGGAGSDPHAGVGPVERAGGRALGAGDRPAATRPAEEVAAAVSFLADPAQSSFITGASLLVDGGWSCTKDSA